MIYKVEFNGGKHQRLHYYWVPYKAIWNGDYRQAFESEKKAGNVIGTTGFKSYLVITTKHEIRYNGIEPITIDKPKSEATFTEVKEHIERNFNDERRSTQKGF